MKKIALSCSLLFVLFSDITGQVLTLENNSCWDVDFNVIALDATSSCPPNKLATVTLLASGVSGTFAQDILDFDALGAGPVYWTGGGTIGSSPWWGLCQTVFPGYGGAPVGSPAFSSSCWTVQTSATFTVTPAPPASPCVVNLQWSEDMAGNVTITAT